MGISAAETRLHNVLLFLHGTRLLHLWKLGPKFSAQIQKDRIVKSHNTVQIHQNSLNIFSKVGRNFLFVSVNEAIRSFLCIQDLFILSLSFTTSVASLGDMGIFEEFLNLLPNFSALSFILMLHYINPYAHSLASDI